MKKIFLCFLMFAASLQNALSTVKEEILEKAQKATVTIEVKSSISSYGQTGSWSGTGFITDIKKGIIVTNEHVAAGSNAIANYIVKFYNGRIAPAKLRYYDLWQDFAFLYVDPKDIPKEVQEISFSSKEAFQNQPVFIVGNNEGQSFSFHDGYISNILAIKGNLAQRSYIINLNAAGGSSGSPVLNEDGEALGLNYGGSKTFALALHGAYINNALKAIKEGTQPKRKHTGIICSLYSLDKAVIHRKFPEELMTSYLKDFPDSRNNILVVQAFIQGSTASEKLQSGDIIWEVSGKKIGSDLYEFDRLMDNAVDDKINIVVYRNGQRIPVTVDLYDVEKNKIFKILEFAGGFLYESNDFISYISDIPTKALVTSIIKPGSGLNAEEILPYSYEAEYYRLKINKIEQTPVHDIDSALFAICNLISPKFITFNFENYRPFVSQYNKNYIAARHQGIADVTLGKAEIIPKLYKFNSQIMEWELDDNPCKSLSKDIAKDN